MASLYLYFSLGLLFWLTAIIILLRSAEKAFYFLAGHFFILGIGIFSRIFIYNGWMLSYPHFYGILFPLQFLYGPFFFFYINKLFNPGFQYKTIHLLHFLPFLFHVIDFAPFFVLSPSRKGYIIQNALELSYFGISSGVYEYLKVSSYALYLTWGIRFYLLYIYYTKVSDNWETRLLHYWIRLDLLLKIVAVTSYFFVNLVLGLNGFNAIYYLFSLDAVLNTFVIYLKPSLLKGFDIKTSPTLPIRSFSLYPVARQFKRLIGLGLQPNDLDKMLHIYLDVRQFHTNPDFTADHLADKIGISRELLEKSLKEKYACEASLFLQFKRLHDLMNVSKGKAIHEVMTKSLYDVGFNSITSLQSTLKAFDLYKNKELFSISEMDCKQMSFLIEDSLSKSH